ncbi:MAG: hypothetical protein KatS3mg115_0267 [Candidatus Poribacteria bacterium]|nr:MAG: hypothetical protein KatS3mg115_0267 [Candidatus Poribacteria bacterium]
MARSEEVRLRTGWVSRLARWTLIALTFEAITGLAITFAPFHPAVQWGTVYHTLIGILTLLPLCWYYAVHWLDYKRYALSHVVLLGYVGLTALVLCALSGVVLTVEGIWGIRRSPFWRWFHLTTTFVALGTVIPHILIAYLRARRRGLARQAHRMLGETVGGTAAGLLLIGLSTAIYSGEQYHNEFPPDYSYVYGEDRPFAPSLATTDTGGAFDARSLAGSESCGTAGCHEQIVEEWKPSAHRYAAMDPLFQKIQNVMAEQNGPESTRYCGGCHDPISLFSGTKNVFVENLTNLHGYQEGVSCLVCHSIRETDLQGNANYVITQPREYLWQWDTEGVKRVIRDFLIRTYPKEHNRLSKRMFKAPEYCAACHKQFIDQEINRVGWVQLQNQYDNWAASHWNQKGDPTKTIECRECHMPLVDSTDPAAGDSSDYNRSPDDGKHRSHRFAAANNFVPRLLKLEGWEEQVEHVERWLRGEYDVPEIQDKWREGPLVLMELEVPPQASPGETIPIRVVLTSNKVGHDFPTGPLDIIQSWVELRVTDSAGNLVFASGRRDEKHFIEPGTFMFKVEPVDQYGNLIDRHNLWEMVGVRYRRALFPGYSDTAEFYVACASGFAAPPQPGREPGEPRVEEFQLQAGERLDTYTVTAILNYRKVDQFLLNFLFGEDSGLTAPVVELARATATVEIVPKRSEGSREMGMR